MGSGGYDGKVLGGNLFSGKTEGKEKTETQNGFPPVEGQGRKAGSVKNHTNKSHSDDSTTLKTRDKRRGTAKNDSWAQQSQTKKRIRTHRQP